MILEDIFLVSSRPDSVKEVQMLNRFKELILLDAWDTPEAIDLHDKLVIWAKDFDPVIKQLQMDIRLRKYRRG